MALACSAIAAMPAAEVASAHTPAPSKGGVSYGVSDDFLAYAGTHDAQLFKQKILHRDGHVRIWTPYDALSRWNGSACAPSPAASDGAVAWKTAVGEVNATTADGLLPEVEIGNGTGIGGTAVNPDPAKHRQALDYRCGVRALENALSGPGRVTSAQVTEYEVVNEPDNTGTYVYNWNRHCTRPAQRDCSGPWRAGELWYTAQTEANALHASVRGFPRLKVAALTMSHPAKTFYLDDNTTMLNGNGYYQSLYKTVKCDPKYLGCWSKHNPKSMPTYWAVHDYGDPTVHGTKDLATFEHNLARLNQKYSPGTSAKVWVTEAGVWLDSSIRSDKNRKNVRCNTAELGGPHRNIFGCVADGHATAQAAGGRDWLRLGGVSARAGNSSVRTSQVYWYEFHLQSSLHSWDSALIDSYGNARPSFCSVMDWPQSACRGRTDDYMTARWVQGAQGCPPGSTGAWVADDPGAPVQKQCY